MAYPTNESPLVNKILPQEDVDALYNLYPNLPRSYMAGCPSCGKNNGYGVNGTVELDGEVYECNCRDQLQLHKHYLDAGIGKTYQFLTWKDFYGDQDAMNKVIEWIDRAEEHIESGSGLYIYSAEYGSGKTFVATMALRSCIKLGYKCYMTTFQNMIANIKSGWKDTNFDKWYKRKVDSSQILLIDDLGKELDGAAGFTMDFAKQTLDSMFRTRVQQGKVTMFTSNMSAGEMAHTYGQAVGSLFNECTEPIKMKAVTGDYRQQVDKNLVGYRYIY